MTAGVVRAPLSEIKHLLLDVHYLSRVPTVSWAYALKVDGVLEGAVTYGSPPSPQQRAWAGPWAPRVLELNRLVLVNNRPNDASRLVGQSLRLLRADTGGAIVISYADQGEGHEGYVYQACNFYYCGMGPLRTDRKPLGMEHVHAATLNDMVRGREGKRSDLLRKVIEEQYGITEWVTVARSRKHRYVYLAAPARMKKQMRAVLTGQYEPCEYPKGEQS